MAPYEPPNPPPSDRADGRADLPTPPHHPEGQRGCDGIHYYSLRRDKLYSLRDAAVILDVDEGRLRREILLNDLPALDAPDDRQYLLSGATLQSYVRMLRPRERAHFEPDDDLLRVLAFFFLLPLLGLALLAWAAVGSAHPVTSPSRTQPAVLPGQTSGPSLRVIPPAPTMQRNVQAPGPKVNEELPPAPRTTSSEMSPLLPWRAGPR